MNVSELGSLFEPQSSPFATHIPLLRAIGKNIRTVLELGAGEFSTRLFLDRTYYPILEKLVTIEQNPDWVYKSGDERHEVCIVDEPIESHLDNIDIGYFDLIFCDNSTIGEYRCKTLKYLSEKRGIGVVVAHDFDVPSYREAAAGFNHALVDDRQAPHTALLWRTK